MGAEEFPSNPERIKSREVEPSPEKPERRVEVHREHHEKETESLEAIQKKIESTAKSSKEIATKELHPEAKHEQYYVNRQLRSNAYNRTMSRVRKHLSPLERPLSKAIHNPIVNAASEAGTKTIARPTGLVTGGLLALLGSSALLYLAKHNGYRYNFGVFFVLFIGGYLLGLAIELFAYIIRKTRRA